ncbi:hypothetical protein HYQ44_015523 [Verticillium longisporum]|nr:hypothetical protein HYQ44_015523 [Verticillium longisporum]
MMKRCGSQCAAMVDAQWLFADPAILEQHAQLRASLQRVPWRNDSERWLILGLVREDTIQEVLCVRC